MKSLYEPWTIQDVLQAQQDGYDVICNDGKISAVSNFDNEYENILVTKARQDYRKRIDANVGKLLAVCRSVEKGRGLS
jgi:hypothetical protein